MDGVDFLSDLELGEEFRWVQRGSVGRVTDTYFGLGVFTEDLAVYIGLDGRGRLWEL